MQIVEKYAQWANQYKEDQITIVYDTVWEGTARLAHELAQEISRQSEHTTVKVFNLAKADKNEVMVEGFKSRGLAVGCPTIGNGILSSVARWMEFLKQLKFKNKKAAAFGCYGWSGESVGILQAQLKAAGFTVTEEQLKVLWVYQEENYEQLCGLASALPAE